MKHQHTTRAVQKKKTTEKGCHNDTQEIPVIRDKKTNSSALSVSFIKIVFFILTKMTYL